MKESLKLKLNGNVKQHLRHSYRKKLVRGNLNLRKLPEGKTENEGCEKYETEVKKHGR